MAGPYVGERYPAYETPRADNYGCYCVPYDQCLPHEVARKEDGIAGIDPRNLHKTDIEAIGLDEVVITDGNGTIVSHHKKTDANADGEKARRRRDVPAAQSKQDAEPVSVIMGSVFFHIEKEKKTVRVVRQRARVSKCFVRNTTRKHDTKKKIKTSTQTTR